MKLPKDKWKKTDLIAKYTGEKKFLFWLQQYFGSTPQM